MLQCYLINFYFIFVSDFDEVPPVSMPLDVRDLIRKKREKERGQSLQESRSDHELVTHVHRSPVDRGYTSDAYSTTRGTMRSPITIDEMLENERRIRELELAGGPLYTQVGRLDGRGDSGDVRHMSYGKVESRMASRSQALYARLQQEGSKLDQFQDPDSDLDDTPSHGILVSGCGAAGRDRSGSDHAARSHAVYSSRGTGHEGREYSTPLVPGLPSNAELLASLEKTRMGRGAHRSMGDSEGSSDNTGPEGWGSTRRATPHQHTSQLLTPGLNQTPSPLVQGAVGRSSGRPTSHTGSANEDELTPGGTRAGRGIPGSNQTSSPSSQLPVGRSSGRQTPHTGSASEGETTPGGTRGGRGVQHLTPGSNQTHSPSSQLPVGRSSGRQTPHKGSASEGETTPVGVRAGRGMQRLLKDISSPPQDHAQSSVSLMQDVSVAPVGRGSWATQTKQSLSGARSRDQQTGAVNNLPQSDRFDNAIETDISNKNQIVLAENSHSMPPASVFSNNQTSVPLSELSDYNTTLGTRQKTYSQASVLSGSVSGDESGREGGVSGSESSSSTLAAYMSGERGFRKARIPRVTSQDNVILHRNKSR